jgi:hypothetical protein
MAATPTKWSDVGDRYSLRENFRTTTAYLMKTALSDGIAAKTESSFANTNAALSGE